MIYFLKITSRPVIKSFVVLAADIGGLHTMHKVKANEMCRMVIAFMISIINI